MEAREASDLVGKGGGGWRERREGEKNEEEGKKTKRRGKNAVESRKGEGSD